MKLGVREKNEKGERKKEEKALKMLFLGYKLKNFRGGVFRNPLPQTYFSGEKNESQKRGGGNWSKCTIYIPDALCRVWFLREDSAVRICEMLRQENIRVRQVLMKDLLPQRSGIRGFAAPFHFDPDPRIRFVEKRIRIRPKIKKYQILCNFFFF